MQASCFIPVLPFSGTRTWSATQLHPKRRRHSVFEVSRGGSRNDKGCSTRQTVRSSSLEDSKRRAKSSYDNIPDLNEQYISELAWIERKYGGNRPGAKNIIEEAKKSIVVSDSRPTTLSVSSLSSSPPSTEGDLTEYKKIKNRLLNDTLFMGGLGLCGAWYVGDLKIVTSFALGAALSVAYVLLLSRSVDRMADAAKAQGGGGVADPLQAARVGLLAVTVIGAAKNSDKLSVLPVIFGFFTYKLATLLPLLTGEAFED